MTTKKIVVRDIPDESARSEHHNASIVGGELYDYPGAYAQRFDGIDPGGADANVQRIRALRLTR